MTQSQAVLDYLKAGYSISSVTAFNLCGATRLSAIIFDLRQKGYNIQTRKRKGVSQYGKSYTYAEYVLVED